MKRCPECRRDYYDDSLFYCLDDGSALLEGPASGDGPATAILHSTGPVSEAATKAQFYGTTGSEPRAIDKRLLLAPLLLAIVVLGGFVGYRYLGSASKQIESIAVMPFVNESGNADVEYLSDGMTESLISSLTQLPNLNVKARSSVFRYKGKETDARTIGKELSVQAILTGRVAQRGEQLTLSLELVDVATENAIWSQQYNHKQSDLVSLQSEIARDVSSKLKPKLSGADVAKVEKNYTANAEAYQLYLKGRFHLNKRSKSDSYKAIEFFQQAIRLDPGYALAFTGLADAYSTLPSYDRTIPLSETYLKARENAIRALSLDESLGEAHASFGLILLGRDHDFIGAEREFKRAIELNPNYASGYNSYVLLLNSLGRHDEAISNSKRALELEPASPIFNRNYAAALSIARKYDESEAQYKKTIELEPNFVLSYYGLASLYLLQGRYPEGVEAYAKSREVVGNTEAAASMRASFARGGGEGFIRDLTNDKWPTDSWPAYIQAGHLLLIGEKDRAMTLLEKAYEDRDGFITYINVDPRLDPLRDDPRFKALVKKVGFN